MMISRFSCLSGGFNQRVSRGLGMVGAVALITLMALPAIAGYDPPARQNGPSGGSTVAGAGSR